MRLAKSVLPLVSAILLIAGCATSGGRAQKVSVSGPNGISVSGEIGAATTSDRLWDCRQQFGSTEDACIAYAHRVASASCHDAIGVANPNFAFCSLCVRTQPTGSHLQSCMSLANAIAKSAGNAASVEISYDPSRPASHSNVPPTATQDPQGSSSNLPIPPLAKDDPTAALAKSLQSTKRQTPKSGTTKKTRI